jgi:CheY-specific phosphatase CheX
MCQQIQPAFSSGKEMQIETQPHKLLIVFFKAKEMQVDI